MERFVIGSLLEHKKDGKRAFLAYSHALAYGSSNSSDLSVIYLDKNGEPYLHISWRPKSQFNVIDSDIESNLEKIRKYIRSKEGGAPICMKPEIARKLGYTSIHTYSSANAGRKEGDIKL